MCKLLAPIFGINKTAGNDFQHAKNGHKKGRCVGRSGHKW